MRSVFLIAINTFREFSRDKLVVTTLVFTGGLLIFSLALGNWAVFYREVMIQSFSIASITFSGLALSIFIGVKSIHGELAKKTVLPLLTHALPRWQFVLGKYLGLQVTLVVYFAIMSGLLVALLTLAGVKMFPGLFLCIYFAYFEMAIVTSSALLFSTFSSVYLSGWFTLGFYLAGQWAGDLAGQIKGASAGNMMVPDGAIASGVARTIAGILRYLLPNFTKLDYRSEIFAGGTVGLGTMAAGTAYASCFVVILLIGASAWFSRRDL